MELKSSCRENSNGITEDIGSLNVRESMEFSKSSSKRVTEGPVSSGITFEANAVKFLVVIRKGWTGLPAKSVTKEELNWGMQPGDIQNRTLVFRLFKSAVFS